MRCGRLVEATVAGFSCEDCRRRYFRIEPPVCRRCGVPLAAVPGDPAGECAACRVQPPELEAVRSLLRYRGTGARLVQSLKYEGGVFLEREIQRLVEEDPFWRDYFREKVVVPVPLHPRKQARRGYNQAEVIARALAAGGCGLGTEAILRRVRATPSQTQLHREARLRNVVGAFRCVRSLDARSQFVLVDDVLTTGATLEACAAALRASGARGISAFTLARG